MPPKVVQHMLRNAYSAECVEQEFCELRLYGVLGSYVVTRWF
jgi:hypothetical protein